MREPSILGGSPADVEVASHGDPAERTTRLYMYATLLLLVFGAVPWRKKQYFSGQFDWVVLGKTGLLIAALLIALWARDTVVRTGRQKNMVPALPLILAVLYMGSTVLGARLFGNFYATVALSARALVIAFAILVLLEIAKPMIVVDALARVLSAVAVFIALTGSFGPTGRLRGIAPPLSPNEIAFLAAVPLLYFVWRAVNTGSHLFACYRHLRPRGNNFPQPLADNHRHRVDCAAVSRRARQTECCTESEHRRRGDDRAAVRAELYRDDSGFHYAWRPRFRHDAQFANNSLGRGPAFAGICYADAAREGARHQDHSRGGADVADAGAG